MVRSIWVLVLTWQIRRCCRVNRIIECNNKRPLALSESATKMDPNTQKMLFYWNEGLRIRSDPIETRAPIRVFWISTFTFPLHCRRWRRRIVAQSKRAQEVPRHQLLTITKSSITRREFISSNKKTTRFRSVLYSLYSVLEFLIFAVIVCVLQCPFGCWESLGKELKAFGLSVS